MPMPTMPVLPDAERERLRGYLIAQAAKLSLAELVAKVRADALPLRDVSASIAPARFRERPAAQSWSAAEVFTHILTITEHGADAIEGIIAQGTPPPLMEDRLLHEEREFPDAAAYWRAFSERRERLFAVVLAARGDERLDQTIFHPVFGALTWREWLLFLRLHDLDHLGQMRQITDA